MCRKCPVSRACTVPCANPTSFRPSPLSRNESCCSESAAVSWSKNDLQESGSSFAISSPSLEAAFMSISLTEVCNLLKPSDFLPSFSTFLSYSKLEIFLVSFVLSTWFDMLAATASVHHFGCPHLNPQNRSSLLSQKEWQCTFFSFRKYSCSVPLCQAE